MVWHLTLDFPLVWIMAWIISCSSRMSLYIDTKSSGSTSLRTTCDMGLILSTWERLVATSCYWQIWQIVPVYTIFYIYESWVRIMQTWSIPGLGCRTMRPAVCYDKGWFLCHNGKSYSICLFCSVLSYPLCKISIQYSELVPLQGQSSFLMSQVLFKTLGLRSFSEQRGRWIA